MSEFNEETVGALVDIGTQAAAPKPIGNSAYAIVPDGAHVEDLTKYIVNDRIPHPDRIRTSVTVLDAESFIEYYTLFSDPNSRVFASEPDQKVVGILDYHGAAEGGPRWCQHRVTLSMRQSEQWKVWIGCNNKQFTQSAFAEFLEQNSMDITKPAPAAILEVARDLQATTEVEFGSGTRMQDGQVRFRYTETTKATVGGNQVSVPEQFTISIPPFVGGKPVEMQALLRFRTKEGHLTIWFTLVRPEEVMRKAFMGARNQISDALSVTIINGAPAA